MQRIPEPELMDDIEQAQAYVATDVDAHIDVLPLLEQFLPSLNIEGDILDLGCGPGNFTFKLAQRFPEKSITAIDGSSAMLRLAHEHKQQHPDLYKNIDFIQAMIPSVDIPKKAYGLIVSTRFLHHLHNPCYLWETVQAHQNPATKVFIADLKRPATKSVAKWIAHSFSANQSPFFKEDMYNSLLAAFTPEEITDQLQEAGLTTLSVAVHADAYIVIHG